MNVHIQLLFFPNKKNWLLFLPLLLLLFFLKDLVVKLKVLIKKGQSHIRCSVLDGVVDIVPSLSSLGRGLARINSLGSDDAEKVIGEPHDTCTLEIAPAQ